MHRCNEQIRLSPVRLIDQDNNQIGIVPTDEALKRARAVNLDLVEIAPTERPPVCRIMDYGKFKYAQKKKKQKHHESKLKEVRLHPKIGEHDIQVKLGQAMGFLDKGDKVQFTMIFRGRERFHQELGRSVFDRLVQSVAEKGKIERAPRMEGARMTLVVAPLKH